MDYTSKQKKERVGNGGRYGVSLITHSRVGYCFPAGTIRDALVGVVDTKNLFHCTGSEGR